MAPGVFCAAGRGPDAAAPPSGQHRLVRQGGLHRLGDVNAGIAAWIGAAILPGTGIRIRVGIWVGIGIGVGDFGLVVRFTGAGVLRLAGAVRIAGVKGGHRPAGAAGEEIGRASCRERV